MRYRFEDPCEMDRLIRQARAQSAISRIRERAKETGLDRLTDTEIQAEIRAVRAARTSAHPKADAETI